MAVLQVQTSFILSLMLSILVFALMQMQKHWFASSQLHTILGGYLGSQLFALLLTAVGNGTTLVFGPRSHTKLFPEVVLCQLVALSASGMVHRVCTTTCFLFSLIGLYFTNKVSKHVVPPPVANVAVHSKKKK